MIVRVGVVNCLGEEFSTKLHLIFLANAQCYALFSQIKALPFDIHLASRERESIHTTMTAMDCTWPEKLSDDRKRAVEELVRGRYLTNQLRVVLRKPVEVNQPVSAEDLLAEILRSFTDTLSILSSGESDEVASQIPASAQLYSPGWDGRKSEGSGESGKSSTKDRRGCYKRR